MITSITLDLTGEQVGELFFRHTHPRFDALFSESSFKYRGYQGPSRNEIFVAISEDAIDFQERFCRHDINPLDLRDDFLSRWFEVRADGDYAIKDK